MTVIVDRREPTSFQEKADDVQELPYGDFHVVVGNEQVYLERKTYGDCWNSLRSGRLDRQLYDLTTLKGNCGLILEKSYVPAHAKSSLHAVMSKVNKMCWALPIIHTLNPVHTMAEVRAVEARLGNGSFRTITRPIEQVDDSDARVRILAGIPGVGPKKARVLLETYGSVEAAIFSVDDWNTEVPGFGKKQVEKATEVLR